MQMSVIDRSQTRDIPRDPSGFSNRHNVWNSRRGTHLGSGHVRPRQQTGHMIASDPIHTLHHLLQAGGRPHMGPGHEARDDGGGSAGAHVMTDWKERGVKVVPDTALDPNTAQTPGMSRATAINRARAGAEKLWAGTVTIHPNAKTGAPHHGDLESVIFVVKGRARMRWGDNLEYVAEAGPGDFIYVPPYVSNEEIT